MTQALTLNPEQQQAADDLYTFLFNNEREHRISGPGGTGKTRLMSYVINTLIPQYFDACKMMGIKPVFDSSALCATTNKAVDELSRATGLPASTIHSFLALKVQADYGDGKNKLVRSKSWSPIHNKIIFIDEASMVDTPLKQEIKDTTVNCKIVYIGDHCQLKPVNESVSPVYAKGAPTSFLTIPMRTDRLELQALNEQLRETVETGIFKPIQIIPGIIDLLSDEEMEAELAAKFSQQNVEDRILAYSNSRVLNYNDHIRTLRGLPDLLTPGENLVNNSATMLNSGMINVETPVFIRDVKPHLEDVIIEPATQDKPAVVLRCQVMDISTATDDFDDVKVPVDKDHYKSLISYYRKRKAWDKMYHLTERYPDLRQRDAATVHKAQGSTYQTTYIDAANLSTCHQPDTAARLLYVAASRSRKRVVFYGELAQKYGGFIH